jgi:hypothetical protein
MAQIRIATFNLRGVPDSSALAPASHRLSHVALVLHCKNISVRV